MSTAKIMSALAVAMLAAASVLNLADGSLMYPDIALAEAFRTNDMTSLAAAVVFGLMILAAKAKPGLLIGIDTAVVYMSVPLALAYGLRLPSILPAAAVAAAVFGIVDQLKIEEVLAAEKAPIKKEHIAYIAISAFVGVLFVVRAALVLGGEASSGRDKMTAVADLVLVAAWAVLIAISIVNADKRTPSLAGIMSGGAALSLALALYFVVDALAGKEGIKPGDTIVVLAMSLVFLVPAYRLLRKRPN